ATYNVRGVTSIGTGGSALVLIDGVPGDPNNLNPNDIENISVLKDASSAAIYGARGSFGVVLITTKTPKKDKFTVSYGGNYSINQRTVTPDLVSDGYTWAKNFDESFASWNDYISHPQSINTQLPFSLPYLDSLKARSEDPSLPKYGINPTTGQYVYYGSTDWFKELYRDNVPSMEHSLSISGGSERVNFMLSGRYFHQDGVFRYNSDNFDRYNLRLKGSIKVNDWLTLNSNTDFSSYSYKYPMTSLGGVNAVWRLMAVSAFPVSPLLNPDGTMTIVGAYSVGDFYYGKSRSITNQRFIRNTVGFNASLIKNKLSFKGDFSYLYTNSQEDRKFFPVPYSIKPGEIINGGPNSLSNSTTTENYYVGNLYADYNQKFGNHNFKVLGGWNLELNQVKTMSAQRDGLLVDDLPDFNLATGQNYRLTGGGNEWSIVGVFYRVNYDYKGKYLAEFNGRYDGSSKFPESQRFGFFPSASAGWRISEEKFMTATRGWLNEFKLRASYGSLGNGNIAPYSFLQTIGAGTSSYIINNAFPNYIQELTHCEDLFFTIIFFTA
ncbi:MAG: SusC/RagA family TonB-linked outer membrane protein, partial [Chitinophagaceae bacterium]